MASTRTLAIILFVTSIVSLIGGILSYIYYRAINRDFEDAFILNTGVVGLFAVTHGILLLKIDDLQSTSVTEASALFAMAVVNSVLSPVVVTRFLMGLFSAGFVSIQLYIPCLTAVTVNIILGIVSIYIAVKQSGRIHSNANDYVVIDSGLNKSSVSTAMIISSFFSFGLSTTLIQERWVNYHVVAVDIQAVMLLATGIMGTVAHNKRAVNMNVWFQTFTTYTAGISIFAVVSIVQLLVHYVNESQNQSNRWARADFTILTLSQAAFSVFGLVSALIAVVAAGDIQCQTPKHRKLPVSTEVNVGMLTSGMLAGGMGIFNMAVMNYPSYGLPAGLISVMVFVAARHGLKIQTVDYDILKYPYYALNVFNSMGCAWAIGMTIYQFLTHANVQTNLVLLYNTFGYIFAAAGAGILLPAAFFSIKAAISSSKDLTSQTAPEFTKA